MKNYICINGKKTELSEESAKNLEKSFGGDEIDRIISELPENPVKSKYKIEREKICGRNYIKIPLPVRYRSWSLWAYDCAMRLCEQIEDCRPFHHDKDGFNHTKWIYIELP